MVSRFFNAIGEVLAPTLQTPLENFRLSWRAIKHFYIDDKDDVEGEGIPEHLNQMIQTLLEEADATEGGRRGTGPCLEFFLQERILPILCHLGEIDRPAGMRRYVLVGVSTVVRNMPGGILVNMHVHEPIRRLLATAVASADHTEVISLAHAVVVNISREKMGGDLGTFFLHPPDSKDAQFVLLSALIPRIELQGQDGEQARQALVLLLAVCQHEAALEPYFATLPSIAIAALPRLYRALPSKLPPDARLANPTMDALIRQLNFYGTLTKAAHQDLRQKFLRVFDDDFVLAILGPALLQPDEAELAASTRYVGYIIDHAEPPLLHALITSLFPIGKSSVDESMSILAASITTRASASNEELKRADLQLVDNALDRALTLLVCPYGSAIEPNMNGESSEAAIEAARAYLGLFPARDAAPTGYDAYLADAHHALMRPAPPSSPSTLSSPRSSVGLYSGEPLVQALWSQIEAFLDQSFDTNLVLTSAIGKMATHPHPAVRHYLFALKSSASLYKPLSQVAQRAEKRCEELGIMSTYQDALSLLRTRMSDPSPPEAPAPAPAESAATATLTPAEPTSNGHAEASTASAEPTSRAEQLLANPIVERFLQSLLLLLEFQKEIAASVHAAALLHPSMHKPPQTTASSPTASEVNSL